MDTKLFRKKGFAIVTTLFVVIFCGLLLTKSQPTVTLLGDLAWELDTKSAIVGTPLFDGDIYIQTSNEIFSIDLLTGVVNWKTSIFHSAGDTDRYFLLKREEVLFVLRNNGPVTALSTETGNILWSNQSIDKDILDANIFENAFYDARYSSFLTSYDIYSGNINWSSNIPSRTSAYIFPEKDVVYLVTNSSIMAFDASGGNKIWEYDINGIIGGIAKNKNMLYLAFLKGECSIAALDVRSQKYLWCIKNEHFRVINDIIFNDDTIFISGNKLIALSSDSGKINWQSQLEDNFGSINVFHNDLFIQGKNTLYKIDANTGIGDGVFKYPFTYILSWANRSNVEPIIANDTILIPINKRLYAYKIINYGDN